MTLRKSPAIPSSAITASAVIASAGAWLLPTAAIAQHVLICFTLHNDLTNFDRRAGSVDYYSKSVFTETVLGYRRAYADYEAACPLVDEPLYLYFRPDCPSLYQEAICREAEYYRLQWLESDPVRRRIIGEMARNHCPIDLPLPPP